MKCKEKEGEEEVQKKTQRGWKAKERRGRELETRGRLKRDRRQCGQERERDEWKGRRRRLVTNGGQRKWLTGRIKVTGQ